MFTLRARDPFGCHGVSCVKLPAAVAFPTDARLLERIEESRRALPPNNIKALWRSRDAERSRSPCAPRVRDVDAQLTLKAGGARTTVERFRARGAARWALPETVHVEDVYARSRLALGQH